MQQGAAFKMGLGATGDVSASDMLLLYYCHHVQEGATSLAAVACNDSG
jgi:hypothetical protein